MSSAASKPMMIPSLSVVQTLPLRLRNDAPALSSPPKPSDPSSRPGTNHLNPTGTSISVRPILAATRSMMLLLTTVLPTAALGCQARTMGKKIENRRCKVMVAIHQARAARHDSVSVGVGIVAKGDIESVFEPDQLCHGVGRRTVHTNLAVPIQRHEAERRIHAIVHDLQIKPEPL